MTILTMFGLRISLRPLLKQAKVQFTACGRAVVSTQTQAGVQTLDHGDAKPYEEIPGPKGIFNLPVIGPMFLYKPFTHYTAETSNKLFDSLCTTYGPIFKVNLGRDVIIVSNPADFATLFQHEGKHPCRPSVELGVFYAKRTGSKLDLSDMQGTEWASLRTPLNKRLMKVDSALHYLGPQNAVADEFVQLLANEKLETKEMDDLFFRFAAESIGVVCFNTRLGLLNLKQEDIETAAFFYASKEIFRCIHKSVVGKTIAHRWYRNKTYKEFERCTLILKEVSSKYVGKAKKVLESSTQEGTLNPEEPNLLLSLLSDQNLHHEDILNIMKSVYSAGTDSTAKNLQTLFFNLAQNPEKQEILRQEIISVIGSDQPLTKEALSKMPYLKACLKESFRLIYPTVSGIMRTLPVDVVLSGYKVPAGTLIGLHNPKTCRDHFEDADKFIPERWLRTSEGRKTQDIPKLAVIPFGHGSRNCIGRRFAEQEIYLSTAKVLQKLKIEVDEESLNTNFIYTIFVQPERPIKFIFTKV